MTHKTTRRFWRLLEALPDDVRERADKQFTLLKQDPWHPSLRLKPVGELWSARINDAYRVLAIRNGDTFVWFFAGNHDGADRVIADA